MGEEAAAVTRTRNNCKCKDLGSELTTLCQHYMKQGIKLHDAGKAKLLRALMRELCNGNHGPTTQQAGQVRYRLDKSRICFQHIRAIASMMGLMVRSMSKDEAINMLVMMHRQPSKWGAWYSDIRTKILF